MNINKILKTFIYFLFFCSGISGLIYEIIWARLLSGIFGSSTIANSIIIAVFMGGLAFGSYIASRYFAKSSNNNPILFYSRIEFLIGISALLSFYLLPIITNIYINYIDLSGSNTIVINLTRFILISLILLIPTTLMGLTLPFITQIMTNNPPNRSKLIGILYAINTFGAIFGVAISSFYLILNYGVSFSFYTAVFLNIFIGFIFLFIYFFSSNSKIQKHKKEHIQLTQQNYDKKLSLIILIVYFFSGFISMALEIVWIRALVFFVGSSTYAFSIILIVYLIGISLGSFLSSFFVIKIKRPLLVFSILEYLLGFTIFISVLIIYHYSSISINGANNFDPIFLSSINTSFLDIFLLTFIIIIIPTLIIGAIFPIVNKILLNENLKSGYIVGKIYSANTFGTIFGSLFGGFFFIPLLGVTKSLLFFCFLSCLLGYILFITLKTYKKIYKILSFSPIVLFLVLIIIPPINLKFKADTERLNDRIIFYKEDPSATVSVFEDENGYRSMSINGMMIGGNQIKSLRKEMMLAHLPLLLHPNPEAVLTVGLGTGITLGDISLYNPKIIECVEIIGSVVEASKLFEKDNLNIINSNKANIYIEDGRNFLLTTKKKYDVIIDDSMLRRESSSNGPLYAYEYYIEIKRCLNDKGLFCQWLPLYLSKDIYKSILLTLKQNFRYISLWYLGHAAIIQIASNEPLQIDLNNLKKRINESNINNRLKIVELNDAYTLLKCFLLDNEKIEKLCKNAVINSDDNPIVEFRVPLETSSQTIFADNLLEMAPLRPTNPSPFLINYDKNDINLLQKTWNDFHLIIRGSILHHLGKEDESFSSYINNLESDSTNKHAKFFLGFGDFETPKEKIKSLIKIGDYYKSRNLTEKAISFYNKALEVDSLSVEAMNSISQIFFENHNYEKAIFYGEKALSIQPKNVILLYNLATYYEEVNNFTKANLLYKKCLEVNPLFEPAKQKINIIK